MIKTTASYDDELPPDLPSRSVPVPVEPRRSPSVTSQPWPRSTVEALPNPAADSTAASKADSRCTRKNLDIGWTWCLVGKTCLPICCISSVCMDATKQLDHDRRCSGLPTLTKTKKGGLLKWETHGKYKPFRELQSKRNFWSLGLREFVAPNESRKSYRRGQTQQQQSSVNYSLVN